MKPIKISNYYKFHRMVTNRMRIIAVALGSCLLAGAKVTLPSVLSSSMVVQHDAPLSLWGTADPGEQVDISVDGEKVASVFADERGRWQAKAPALKAGGPYEIHVGDLTLSDVLSGDVLLCSGQSNMELPVSRVTDMFAQEIASYENPQVRQYIVPKEFEFDGPRQDSSPSAWLPATQQNVMKFSAVAYFIAKDLNARTGRPVGIINASWGGTPIEAWISEDVLAEGYPYAVAQKAIYNDAAYRQHIKDLEAENYARWNNVLYGADKGVSGSQKWYDPQLDESDWATVDLFDDDWSSDGLNPINGSHWLRKSVTIPAEWAGKPATLRLGCVVDADSVYVNGNFVGTTSYQYPPRIYQVPAGVLVPGENNITVRLISQSGAGHFVKEKPYKLILGGQNLLSEDPQQEVSLEGEWKYKLGARMPAGPSMMFYCYIPAVLYNGMIAPVIQYPVAGAVWYQGESNVGSRNEYAALLDLLVCNWRNSSGNADMPFYIIELADFLHPSDIEGRKAWAEMRQQQAKAAQEISGCKLIKNSDLGEWNDIHPLDKKTLGSRVADAIYNNMKSK